MSAVPPVTPPAATPATVGLVQKVETVAKADLTAIENRLAALEANAKSWFETNWPHFVTWAMGVALAIKAFL